MLRTNKHTERNLNTVIIIFYALKEMLDCLSEGSLYTKNTKHYFEAGTSYRN